MIATGTLLTPEEKLAGVGVYDSEGAEQPSAEIEFEDNIQPYIPGEYTISYTCSMAGYELNTVYRTIIVKDSIPPVRFIDYSVDENCDEIAIYRSENNEDYIRIN